MMRLTARKRCGHRVIAGEEEAIKQADTFCQRRLVVPSADL